MTIVACTFGDPTASGEVEELLTLARRLSESNASDLRWLVAGSAPRAAVEELAAAYGVPTIDRIDDPKLEGAAPDASVEALAQYYASRPPATLLLSQTFDARLVAPRLAARLNATVIMNTVGIESDADTVRVTVSAYGGDTRAVYELTGDGPHVIGVMANATAPERSSGATPVINDVSVDLSRIEERIRIVERTPEQGPRLEDANIIVAGGRGLGSADKFQYVEALAEALGGMAAASRPIVDDGWADPSRQIGLTGKVARPSLYIAAGISGASQHMAGCSAAKTIVAINSDPDAPIFRYARYGIVGDCIELLTELTSAVKAR